MFSIKELIEAVLHSNLDEEEKLNLLEKIYMTGRINDDLYLRRNHGDNYLECWYRTYNNKGEVTHIGTGYDANEVMDAYLAKNITPSGLSTK